MNRISCIAVFSTLALAACATPQTIYTDANPRTRSLLFASPPNPTSPNVFVTPDTKMILVDQEPIYPPPGSQVTIYFALQTVDYEFHSNGIEIQGNPSFCAPVTGSTVVVKCSYTRPAAGTVYKYKVRVRPVGGGQPLKDLDPSIMN